MNGNLTESQKKNLDESFPYRFYIGCASDSIDFAINQLIESGEIFNAFISKRHIDDEFAILAFENERDAIIARLIVTNQGDAEA